MKVTKVLIVCAVMCLCLAVSSCRKRTPAQVAAKEDKSPAGIVILESESNGFDISSNLPLSGDGFWNTDFKAAKAKAAEEKKDLLVNFSGIEWCPPCKQLEAEVLSKTEFKTEVSKKYVPVLLDFPRDTSKASEQNQRLSRVFGHRYFPTVYLTDSNGRAYGKIVSYVPGGPKNYLQQIEGFRKVKVQFSELMATTVKDGLSDVEKAKRIEKAILLLDPELLRQFYKDEIKRMVALDKDNVAGLKEKYGFTSIMWQVVDLQIAGDFAGALEAVNAGEKEMKLAGEQLQQLYFVKAGVQYRIGDKDGSIQSVISMTDGGTAEEVMGIVNTYVQTIPDAVHVSKTIDAVVEHLNYKGVQLQQMLYMKSEVLFALEDKAGSLKSLKGALAAAPDGPMADRIKEIIGQYFSDQ